MSESSGCSSGGWRSRIPVSTTYRTPEHPRARRQLPFGTPKREIFPPEPVPMFARRPPRDPRRRLFTPKRDCYTYEERAALSQIGQYRKPAIPPTTPKKPTKFMPSYPGVNYGRVRKGLFQSPDCNVSNASNDSYDTARESPESSYGSPPLSEYPFCPPPPPPPLDGFRGSPWDSTKKPYKLRSTALPGVVTPITSPFSHRDPSEFVSMHDLINQDFLRLGPFPPPRPLAHSTPKRPLAKSEYYDMRGMRGRYFPTPTMFDWMSPGEWGADADEYWPDRYKARHLYDPATAIAPNAPPKIKISPWPKHHPAPQC